MQRTITKEFATLGDLLAFVTKELGVPAEVAAQIERDVEQGLPECGCANCVARRTVEKAAGVKPSPKQSPITAIEFNNIMLMLRDFIKGVGNKHALLNARACVVDAVNACMPKERATQLLLIPRAIDMIWLDAIDPV